MTGLPWKQSYGAAVPSLIYSHSYPTSKLGFSSKNCTGLTHHEIDASAEDYGRFLSMFALCDVRRDRCGVRGLLQLFLALHPQQLHPRVRLLHLVHLRESVARKSNKCKEEWERTKLLPQGFILHVQGGWGRRPRKERK